MTILEIIGIIIGSSCLIAMGVIGFFVVREKFIRYFDDTVY